MADDCLHCRLMEAIDDWRIENPDHQGANILDALSETMGNVLALFENASEEDVLGALATMSGLVLHSFAAYCDHNAAEEASSAPAAPRGPLH